MAKPIPNAERVRELLDYDQNTGLFTRKINCANHRAGEIAGCAARTYIGISVDDVIYRAHQLAWLWMTGEWPTFFIDHKDTNKQNNIWGNLRPATKSQNMANRGAQKSNTSGFKGVFRYTAGEKYGKPWQAGIQVNGRKMHLGHFSEPETAHAAYCAAAHKYFGEFARA